MSFLEIDVEAERNRPLNKRGIPVRIFHAVAGNLQANLETQRFGGNVDVWVDEPSGNRVAFVQAKIGQCALLLPVFNGLNFQT